MAGARDRKLTIRLSEDELVRWDRARRRLSNGEQIPSHADALLLASELVADASDGRIGRLLAHWHPEESGGAEDS
ncbi:MAG: hypothetical protein U0821_23555 [Chloroflexota bacterium]